MAVRQKLADNPVYAGRAQKGSLSACMSIAMKVLRGCRLRMAAVAANRRQTVRACIAKRSAAAGVHAEEGRAAAVLS